MKNSNVKQMLAEAQLDVDICHTTHRFCEDAESPWAFLKAQHIFIYTLDRL